ACTSPRRTPAPRRSSPTGRQSAAGSSSTSSPPDAARPLGASPDLSLHREIRGRRRSAGSVVGPDALAVVAGDVALGPPLRGPLMTVVGDHAAAPVRRGAHPRRRAPSWWRRRRRTGAGALVDPHL